MDCEPVAGDPQADNIGSFAGAIIVKDDVVLFCLLLAQEFADKSVLNGVRVFLPTLRLSAEIDAIPVHRRESVDGKRSSQSWNLAELVKDQECAVRKADGRRL